MSEWFWAEKRRGRKKKLLCTGLVIAAVFLMVMGSACYLLWDLEGGEAVAYTAPKRQRADLEQTLQRIAKTVGTEPISREDYRLIREQTGLHSVAVDDLMRQGETGRKKILQCQENFYEPVICSCEKIGIGTYEERMERSGEEGKPVFFFPDLKNGDVLVTRNTHTLGWRHGHAAIVVDAESGTTLECLYWGQDSCLESIEKWQNYPNVILLRLSESEKMVGTVRMGDAVADYALQNLLGVSYGLLSGIPAKAPDEIKKTQCAHLVWSSFKHFGYDVDSDGGWLVTPKDLAESGMFDVVQTFGGDEF